MLCCRSVLRFSLKFSAIVRLSLRLFLALDCSASCVAAVFNTLPPSNSLPQLFVLVSLTSRPPSLQKAKLHHLSTGQKTQQNAITLSLVTTNLDNLSLPLKVFSLQVQFPNIIAQYAGPFESNFATRRRQSHREGEYLRHLLSSTRKPSSL